MFLLVLFHKNYIFYTHTCVFYPIPQLCEQNEHKLTCSCHQSSLNWDLISPLFSSCTLTIPKASRLCQHKVKANKSSISSLNCCVSVAYRIYSELKWQTVLLSFLPTSVISNPKFHALISSHVSFVS